MQPDAQPVSDIAAIFDIDETLVRGASSYWAAKEMFLHRFFGVSDLAFAAFQTLRFVLFGENIDKIDDFTHRAAQLVAGQKVDDLRELGKEIFEQYFLPNAYTATLERLNAHLEAGHQVFLASATPWIISEVFAERLGATLGLGTRLKVANGRLLPELDGPILHANGKATTVRKIAQKHGIDLAKSWAYSDSSGDIPLLSAVGNPVAVNPDPGLRAYAKLRNWEILQARTRKDKIKRRSILLSTSIALTTLTALLGFGTYKLVRRQFSSKR